MRKHFSSPGHLRETAIQKTFADDTWIFTQSFHQASVLSGLGLMKCFGFGAD